MIVLALACSGPSDAELTLDALAAIQAGQPAEAVAVCARVKDPRGAAECRWEAAAALAVDDLAQAQAACAPLTGPDRDECLFRVAEAAGSVGLCGDAGELEVKCRLHAYRDALGSWVPSDSRVGTISEDAGVQMERLGIDRGTEAAWFRTYRYVIATTASDTTSQECEALPPIQAKACLRALDANDQRPEVHKP